MSDAAGELAYGVHLLRLQQRRLGLSTRLDLRPEFLGPERHGAFELLPVPCQRSGGGTKSIADLVEFTHPAVQFTNRCAARYGFGGGCQRLDRASDRLSHPPSEEQA